MKKIVLPAIAMIAIFIITLGTVTGASSEAKDPTTGIAKMPAEQANEAAAAVVKTTLLTPANSLGNYRHPGVAEDSKGNRLVIFRGTSGKEYDYVYCPKGGTWSAPKSIANGNQPALTRSLYANIEVDSDDRFHCEWEDAKAAVYASFKDGVWTTPIIVRTRARYDLTSGLTVNSKGDVITADCEVANKSKDIYLHKKVKGASAFGNPFNVSRDPKAASTQPCVAVDSKDNLWVVWKSDFLHDGLEENLVIYLSQFNGETFADIGDWYMMSPDPGWSFLAQVAVNSEDKVMTMYAYSKGNQYFSRSFDPETKKLGDMASLEIGLCRQPWHTFFSRLDAHGKDFYAAAMDPGRILWLLKYNETANKWSKFAQISDQAAEIFDMYSGYDHMLIAWNSKKEPTKVYVTTVEVDPFSKITIKSPINLNVTKNIERTFFHALYLNTLTWAANPENTEKNINIVNQRIYRKARAEDDSKWVRIAQVSGTVLTYEDRDITAGSDYVYSITCVDDLEHESKVF